MYRPGQFYAEKKLPAQLVDRPFYPRRLRKTGLDAHCVDHLSGDPTKRKTICNPEGLAAGVDLMYEHEMA